MGQIALLLISVALCICCEGLEAAAFAKNFFPADSGVVNVKSYGAKGDGISDDTEAILLAIKSLPAMDKNWPWNQNIIFFPKGVYVVSDTIKRRDGVGLFEPNLVLVGESSGNTVIKLSDKSPSFSNPQMLKPVIQMTSGLRFLAPDDGGRDYLRKGEGNDAYGNSIESLTINIGAGNPGAVAVDYLANNLGCMRAVKLVTETPGGVAVQMTRKWIGPALLQKIDILGPFEIGIEIANSEYSVTLDSVHIEGATKYGIRNNDNVVAFSDLTIRAAGGIGIANVGRMGLIAGREGRILGSGTRAIQNTGYLNLDKFAIDEFQAQTVNEAAEIELHKIHSAIYDGERFLGQPAWNVRVESAPATDDELDRGSVSVASFGAVPNVQADSTAAFQAAFSSGARKIYIPNGRYSISAPLEIGSSVELVDGLYSTIVGNFPLRSHSTGLISPIKEYFEGPPPEKLPALLNEAPRTKPLKIHRISVSLNAYVKTAIEHDKPATLILQDMVVMGRSTLYRERLGGKVFGENLAASAIQAYGAEGLWFRQLNTEGEGIRILNDGSPLFVTGIKTEQECVVLRNENGGKADIVGGLIYLVFRNRSDLPIFENHNASISISYAEEAFQSGHTYRRHLVSTAPDLLIRDSNLPKRGDYSRMNPFTAAK